MSWDPAQYLKYGGERLRPALDLLARVGAADPAVVYDLGCGTGALARLMAERWPNAAVNGVDSSPEMLSRAPEGAVTWQRADLNDWAPAGPADVIYSNAALHWLDDHAALFGRLLGGLRAGGVLAVQMPRNHGAPSHTCMAEAADAGPWRDAVRAALRPSPVSAPAFYYDVLAPLSASLDIWESEYIHVLDGDDPVVEWTKGTALRPLLDAAGDQADGFLAAYTDLIRAAYPKQPDGKTLFPFRRLFLVAGV